MCISPNIIPNPNYGIKPIAGTPMSLKDCSSQYLYIPCGYCEDCIAVKQMALVQRCQVMAKDNHVFFTTLTYNNESLPILTTSSGFDIRYSNCKDVVDMIKRLRKRNSFGRSFKYFFVSERGSKKGRPHFHILWFLPRLKTDTYCDIINLESKLWSSILDEWRTNHSKNWRRPEYTDNCTYATKWLHGKLYRNYDTHAVLPWSSSDGISSVAFYVIKYMLKCNDKESKLQQALHLNLPEDEYFDVWNTVRSRYCCSKGFGYPESYETWNYLRECVEKSKRLGKDYPCYFNPDTGQSFPLARYYRGQSAIYDFKDALDFYYMKKIDSIDSPYTSMFPSIDRMIFKERSLERKRFLTEHSGDFGDIDFLFE